MELITGQDIIIAAMAVSLQGNRIAISTVNPLRFSIYEHEENNSEWKQYGEAIHAMEFLNDDIATNATNFEEALITSTPIVILSDDGRTFAISLSTKAI